MRKHLVSVAAIGLLSTASAGWATTYTIVNLGAAGPAGTSSYADAINDLGQIVGATQFDSSGYYHAAVFSNGTVRDLGTFSNSSNATSYANGINNAGQIVGQADLPNLGGNNAFVTAFNSNSPLIDLGTLPLSSATSPYTAFPSSSANAINNAGLIVGVSNIAPPPSGLANGHAALFSKSSAPVDLGPNNPTLSSVANAVNSSGLIGGATFIPNTSSEHAFLQQGPTGAMQILPNLGNDASLYSAVSAVNDTGTAVGVSQTSVSNTSIEHAFVYSNGTITDLGTLNGAGTLSEAYGINNAGQIVGDSQFSNTAFNSDPFLYSNGVMVDLNTLNPAGSPFVSLNDAYAINNLGQIVGDGTLANGAVVAYVLSPVPEPASATLLVTAAALLGRRRRQSR